MVRKSVQANPLRVCSIIWNLGEDRVLLCLDELSGQAEEAAETEEGEGHETGCDERYRITPQ